MHDLLDFFFKHCACLMWTYRHVQTGGPAQSRCEAADQVRCPHPGWNRPLPHLSKMVCPVRTNGRRRSTDFRRACPPHILGVATAVQTRRNGVFQPSARVTFKWPLCTYAAALS